MSLRQTGGVWADGVCRAPRNPGDGNLEGSRATGSLRPMTVRRLLPLLFGLWAASAGAQPLQAVASVALDGGAGLTTAYVVTSNGAQYGMANAGQDLEVFGSAGGGTFVDNQPGQFLTFAVADQFTLGSSTTTLVFAADVGAACSLSPCVDAFLWTQAGFVAQTQAQTTGATAPTAMTVDTTDPTTIRVYFATGGNPATLYEQDFVVNGAGTGISALNTPLSKSILTAQVLGLTADNTAYPSGFLYISDSNAAIWTVPKNYVSAGGTLNAYATPNTGGYVTVEAINWTQGPYLLAGAGNQGLYALQASAAASGMNVFLGQAAVLAVANPPNPVGRQTQPFAASYVPTLTLVTEQAFVSIDAGPNPWLHFVTQNPFPSAGPDAGSGGVDSGIPTIPIIPPGPGQLTGTANSCNCSTAGSAPGLLALLLPLLVRRRRR